MKIRTFFQILIILLLSGCSFVHLDSLTEFHIRGRVFDKKENTPLGRVKVNFIDVGFDSVRSKKKDSIEIGESDSFGNIDFTFNYFWGTERGLLKENPNMTFDIKLTADRYISEVSHFKARDLLRKGNGFDVPLGNIYLTLK